MGLTEENLLIIESEYHNMIKNLNLNNIHTRDVFMFYKGFNPITYGDKDPETGIMETCLTCIEDLGSRQSLDYIFECFFVDELDDNSTENKPIKSINKRLSLDPDSLRVEKFLINQVTHTKNNEKSKKMYSQLSDHYGLSCEIIYQKALNLEEEPFTENNPSENFEDKLNDEQKNLLDIL